MERPDETVIKQLTERIEVFPVQGKGKERTQRVIIHYRFIGIVHIPERLAKNCTPVRLNTRKGVAAEYLPSAW